MVFWTVFAVLVSRLMTLVVLDDKKGIIMMLQRVGWRLPDWSQQEADRGWDLLRK